MIELITANKGDLPRIQAILEGARTYSHHITGKGVKPDAAEKLFETLPQKKNPEDKLLLIARKNGVDVAVVDLVHSYPDPGTAFLGLLLLPETLHRQGLGRTVYLEVEKLVKEVELKKIRLAVLETNPVMPFWEKMGFKSTGETKDYRNKKIHSVLHVMEKELS